MPAGKSASYVLFPRSSEHASGLDPVWHSEPLEEFISEHMQVQCGRSQFLVPLLSDAPAWERTFAGSTSPWTCARQTPHIMTVSRHVSALSPRVLPLPSLEVLPCRINNLTMDSSAEYGHVRPSPVVPLGVEGAQQSALEEAFGPVPPPYVSEAEALLDTGIKTMEVRLDRKGFKSTV